MKTAMLNAKLCKSAGYHFKKKVPIDIEQENFLDYAVPFKFGLTNATSKYQFEIPELRTIANSFTIHTFRDLGFEVGDMIYFDRNKWFVEDVKFNYYNVSRYRKVKHYFLVVK